MWKLFGVLLHSDTVKSCIKEGLFSCRDWHFFVIHQHFESSASRFESRAAEVWFSTSGLCASGGRLFDLWTSLAPTAVHPVIKEETHKGLRLGALWSKLCIRGHLAWVKTLIIAMTNLQYLYIGVTLKGKVAGEWNVKIELVC